MRHPRIIPFQTALIELLQRRKEALTVIVVTVFSHNVVCYLLFSRRNLKWKTQNLAKNLLVAVNFSLEQLPSSPEVASWPHVEAAPQLEVAAQPPALAPRATRSY